MKKQVLQARQHRGGTLVGFVVGVLVGLGAALAVAVYVTRVPMPFVDRDVTRSPADDLAEAERNRGWNPNAALGAAAPAAAPPPAAIGAEGSIVVPSASGQVLPGAPLGDAPRPDPLGDLVQSRLGPTAVAAAPPAAEPAVAPLLYYVQAGAFRMAEDAEAQRAQLALLGIAAEISEREQAGRTVFRVRAGPFNEQALAESTRAQIQASGVAAVLVPSQR